ncbi:MAG: type II and III secretion system protein [Elusimicrobiales bacterium]|nr:type II and III secretion system protein [Elusimicrobiales bacterium]
MRYNKPPRLALLAAVLALAASAARAQKSELVAVSADVVEISGSLQTTVGFTWNQSFQFDERSIPGVFTINQFDRKTGVSTTLKLLEQEGRAQLLSNPKVITKSGTQANFVVGGEVPIPYTNNQGVGADYKKYGVILNVLPVILAEKKDYVDVQLQLEVSNPDYSQTVTVQNTTVPSMITRQIQNEVELKSGDTLVIGGLKSSTRNVSTARVPFLGRLPLIGALFRQKDVKETQTSLFLFITVEIVK